MANFKKNFLRLIDSGANQAKGLVESFNDLIESFDMDAQMDYFNERKKELIKKSNELFSDFSELLKQVKENLTDFSVTVPYDETIGEKIEYNVNGEKLEIEVSYSDETSSRCNKTSVLIPENCDVEQMSFSKNTALKTATIVIPKKFAESKNETVKEDEGDEITPTYYCPTLGTLMTEDEVKDGVTIRGGYPVVKLPTAEELTEPKQPKVKVKSKKKKTVVKQKAEEAVETPAETPIEPVVESTEDVESAEVEAQEEPDETIPQHISSKLASRLQKNVSKYATALKRDASGRFVRREPNN